MVVGVGNILNAVQQRQLIALQSTATALDNVQLRLASGKKVLSALDQPQNFFASRSLTFRAGDLIRLLDGIGQNLQVIKTAQHGIEAINRLLDGADSFLTELEKDVMSGLFDGLVFSEMTETAPPAIPPAPPFDPAAALQAAVDDILAANPEAIHLGGGWIVHQFTAVGATSFTVPDGADQIDYLVVGGGGSGGTSLSFSNAGGGGGGAGGVVTGTMNVTSGTTFNVTVGAGGNPAMTGNTTGQSGQNSSFGSITALGGGAGIGGNGNGQPGGSGGGGRGGTGGAGQQPGSASGGLGSAGGGGDSPAGHGGGGGGGATGTGGIAAATGGGAGGTGIMSDITGANMFYGGGGGGGGAQNDPGGTGGTGGGGTGANNDTAATAGAANTGGGGGGGNNNRVGAAGGSGVVIVSYEIEQPVAPPPPPPPPPPPDDDTDISLLPQELEEKYRAILEQIDLLALDASYRGTNLLDGDIMTTFFNEHRTSKIETTGIYASSAGLGLNFRGFRSLEDIQEKIADVREARTTIRAFSSSLTNDLNVIHTREETAKTMINVLREGSDKLTLADQNEEGAKMLALQTRQLIQFSAFSARLANIADFLV